VSEVSIRWLKHATEAITTLLYSEGLCVSLSSLTVTPQNTMLLTVGKQQRRSEYTHAVSQHRAFHMERQTDKTTPAESRLVTGLHFPFLEKLRAINNLFLLPFLMIKDAGLAAGNSME